LANEIVMPRLSDSMEEGTIARWLVAAGDPVKPGDPLVEVETDKATVTYECEHGGTILLLAAAEGQSIAVGAVIAAVGAPGETVTRPGETVNPPGEAVGVADGAARAGDGRTEGAAAITARGPVTRVKASPLARRVAAQLGVDLAAVSGSGPHGRVIRADVELHAGGDHPAVSGGAKGDATVRKLSRLQQTIARRMAESRSTVPDFELRRELDMGAVVEVREQLRKLGEQLPSYNDFIVRACALALREFPQVNGAYRGDSFETYDRVNIGIAVAAEDALVVPTIFDADRKSLAEIGQRSSELAEKARAGSVTPAELGGATFTISNLGMYGVDGFSAVINPPQAAILAVGSLKPRPVVAADGVTLIARPTLHVSLACDHRILYGAAAARFLERVAQLLESPVALVI
jgi:pyruvate dehydrogenase E2 component (dihydrolipoamide acetyltransferase)